MMRERRRQRFLRRIPGVLVGSVGWINDPASVLLGHADGFWVACLYTRRGGDDATSRVFQVDNFYLENHRFVVYDDDAVPFNAALGSTDEDVNVVHAALGVFTGSEVRFYKNGALAASAAFGAVAYNPAQGGGGLVSYGGAGTNVIHAVAGSDDGTYPDNNQALAWFSACKAANGIAAMPGSAAEYEWIFDANADPLVDRVAASNLVRTGGAYTLGSYPLKWAW